MQEKNQHKPLLAPRAVKFRKDMIKWSGSSDILRKLTDFGKIANQRILIMSVVLFVLFGAIAVQLVQIQIYQQEEYIIKLENYTKSYQTVTPPRGQMFDRNGQLVVENVALLNMIYTPMKGVSQQEEWLLAQLVASHFFFDVEQLSIKEKKDAFLKLYPEVGRILITEQEWSAYYAKELSDAAIYQMKMDRITPAQYESMSPLQQATAIVKMAMELPSSGQPKLIKEDMTFEEASYLAENKELFKGFDVSNDWKRNYLYDNSLRSIFGKVSTSKQGLPGSMAGLYLAQGYARNERIGLNGLELQYEFLLKGSNTILDKTFDELTGLPVAKQLEPGKKGNDLRLSIDMDLQQAVEMVVAKALQEASTNEYRRELENIYVVMMDPITGDVLSMVGKHLNDDNTISDNPENTIWAGLEAGSVVKGATMYMGYQEKLVKQGEKLVDEPIYLLATPMKKSWRNMGLINDIEALKWSSNVYMFRVAMRLAGSNYVPNGPLYIRNAEAFYTMRNYFSKFGLGVMTGIDIPGETIGYLGDLSNASPGHLLDYAIGQFDTYTTIEVAQYISTIANDGIRVQPRLLIEAYETGTQNVVYQQSPTILNTLEGQANLDRVQEGFLACVQSGYCASWLNQVGVQVAAKSGTAEAIKRVFDVNGTLLSAVSAPNSTFIAYAPYDKPEVAMACAAPHAWVEKSQSNICQKITADALKAYFNGKKQ